ncbi:dimethylsulfoxide reductase [Alginatibacterium sediminis]|uniref:Dimethylsulfoxide reductase n=1 Tax=Alginatibacterium sediminis TaxID=2164068 RepID=A0A420EHC8_9ALTE|nr:DmsC/YnfH family molybdoenzyme membrane anchor subunit [Alginatibacterium sediminis]RKF20070.1 dimethylsulfoxide reductase [Alginatibacterium sediminis]
MAWHEWPLVVFTVFAQTAFGAYLLINLAIVNQEPSNKTAGIKLQFFVWVFMGLGLLASTAHLGSPLRAINAFNQVGSSWLSNEILSSVLFFASGGVLWLLTMLNKTSPMLNKILLVLSIVFGAFFMYAMINVYLINTVPTWNTIYTPLAFVATIVVSGVMYGHSLLSVAKLNTSAITKFSKLVVGAGLVLILLSTVNHIISLNDISSSLYSASSLVPQLAQLVSIRLVLLIVGVGLWLFGCKQGVGLQFFGFALVLISELMSRGVFFGLHMTAGM